MGSYTNQVPAVARAIDLLNAVADSTDGSSSGELEGVVEGSRSGLFALLNTLKDRSWLVQDATGRYRIGPALRRLAPSRDQDDDTLRAALADAMVDHPVGETVALVRPDGTRRVVIDHHDADRAVRCVYRIGQERVGTGAVEVASEPGGIDDHGVARCDENDLVEIAAPICRDGHLPIAVVVAGVPRQRADDDHLATVAADVRTLAVDTSLRLGAPRWQPWGAADANVLEPGRPLDQTEIEELLTGRHGAQLACLREDGTPHVVPLWFHWDGQVLWLAASPGASWAAYVGAGSLVSLTIEEPWPALRRVFVTGWAEPVSEPELEGTVEGGVAGLRRGMLARHLGGDEARALPDPDPGTNAGWTAIRLTPQRLHGRAGLVEAMA